MCCYARNDGHCWAGPKRGAFCVDFGLLFIFVHISFFRQLQNTQCSGGRVGWRFHWWTNKLRGTKRCARMRSRALTRTSHYVARSTLRHAQRRTDTEFQFKFNDAFVYLKLNCVVVGSVRGSGSLSKHKFFFRTRSHVATILHVISGFELGNESIHNFCSFRSRVCVSKKNVFVSSILITQTNLKNNLFVFSNSFCIHWSRWFTGKGPSAKSID